MESSSSKDGLNKSPILQRLPISRLRGSCTKGNQIRLRRNHFKVSVHSTDVHGAGKAVLEAPAEPTSPPPAPVAALVPVLGPEKPVKRMMKTSYQLEVLEKTYAVEQYPSEAMRLELSAKVGLTDRQLQTWFCRRRLKDRKPPFKRQRREEEEAALAPCVPAPLAVLPAPMSVMPLVASSDLMVDTGRRYYEPQPIVIAPVPSMQLTESELSVIDSVESQLREPLREECPTFGVEFDPLPPGAFGDEPQPIVIVPAIPSMQLTQSELCVIDSVESKLGEPLRKDGPTFGVEFDPLPPSAFGDEPQPIMIAPAIPSMQLTQSELRVIDSVESKLGEPLRKDGPTLGAR